MNIDVGGLAGQAAHRWLMDEDSRVRKRKSLPPGSRSQEQGSHAGRLTNADRGDVWSYELHGVINGKTSGDGSTWTIDIQ